MGWLNFSINMEFCPALFHCWILFARCWRVPVETAGLLVTRD